MRPILVKDIPFLYALLYAVKRTFAIRLVLRALEAGECLSAVKRTFAIRFATCS